MKFIKLTTTHRFIYVNVNSIEVIMPNTTTKGSSILLSSSKQNNTLEVLESEKEVLTLINEINEINKINET